MAVASVSGSTKASSPLPPPSSRLGHLLLLLLQDRKKDDAMPEVVLKIDYRFDFLPCWSAGTVLSLGPGSCSVTVPALFCLAAFLSPVFLLLPCFDYPVKRKLMKSLSEGEHTN